MSSNILPFVQEHKNKGLFLHLTLCSTWSMQFLSAFSRLIKLCLFPTITSYFHFLVKTKKLLYFHFWDGSSWTVWREITKNMLNSTSLHRVVTVFQKVLPSSSRWTVHFLVPAEVQKGSKLILRKGLLEFIPQVRHICSTENFRGPRNSQPQSWLTAMLRHSSTAVLSFIEKHSCHSDCNRSVPENLS